MVVAKDEASHAILSEQFAPPKATIKREYLALVWGTPCPAAGRIDHPIGRDPHHRLRMAVVKETAAGQRGGGRFAATNYQVRSEMVAPLARVVRTD
eukprot:COSAG01_NODE_27227_length_691_cov_0.548986_1_plen_96_part_00